jgi:hypothetical protein
MVFTNHILPSCTYPSSAYATFNDIWDVSPLSSVKKLSETLVRHNPVVGERCIASLLAVATLAVISLESAYLENNALTSR